MTSVLTTKIVMIDGNWRRIPMVLTKTPKGWSETTPTMKEARNG